MMTRWMIHHKTISSNSFQHSSPAAGHLWRWRPMLASFFVGCFKAKIAKIQLVETVWKQKTSWRLSCQRHWSSTNSGCKSRLWSRLRDWLGAVRWHEQSTLNLHKLEWIRNECCSLQIYHNFLWGQETCQRLAWCTSNHQTCWTTASDVSRRNAACPQLAKSTCAAYMCMAPT